MSGAAVLSNGPTSPVRYPGRRRQSTINSLASSHRSIAPQADAVIAAQKQAVQSLTSLDLGAQLAALLEEKRRDHSRLEVELDASLRAVDSVVTHTRARLSALRLRGKYARNEHDALSSELADAHEALGSPLQPTNSHTTQTQAGQTLMDILKSQNNRLASLTQLEQLFAFLARSEEFSLICREQLKLPTSDMARKTYIEYETVLWRLESGRWRGRPGRLCAVVALSGFIEFAAWVLLLLAKALDRRLLKSLDAMQWPIKKRNMLVDYVRDPTAQTFRSAFFECAELDRIQASHPLPEATRYYRQGREVAIALPIHALAHPLVLRFRYHFDSQRPTNRLDKPEWFFAHVLNAITDHSQFLLNDVQLLIDKAYDSQPTNLRISALTDFISALMKPLDAKIRRSVSQLLNTNVPNLIAHTIYQAIAFDTALQAIVDYQPRYTNTALSPNELVKPAICKWHGTADIILGNRAWFDGWKDAEKKSIDDRFYGIISAHDAWHIAEDLNDTDRSGEPRPGLSTRCTNSSLKVCELFDSVTQRYASLPELQYKIPFLLDIQLPLLDTYLARLHGLIDAFESLSYGLMRAVPGTLAGPDTGQNARLTHGVAGLQRLLRAGVSTSHLAHQCQGWGEDPAFLEMWRDLQMQAGDDASIRASCTRLLERGAVVRQEEDTLFNPWVRDFSKLDQRIKGMLVKHVVREVMTELKVYIAKRVDAPDSTPSAIDTVSTDLAASLNAFAALLSAMAQSLTPIVLSDLYRQIVGQLGDHLVNRAILGKVWSERSSLQFAYDVEHGWLPAASRGLSGRIRRPDIPFRRLVDASRLLSVPSALRQGSDDLQTVTMSYMVRVTWDENAQDAYASALQRLDVKTVINRQEVKAILRKRPECWR